MSTLIGQRLGQYDIVAELGEGGMAVVYRAHQINVSREVAVKVIRADLATQSDFVARFDREAQTIAGLSHPHILKLFDYGQHGDMVYLVSELLSGGSLADLIAQGPLALKRVDKLLNKIASALEYAHARGIIHRDLKPANVLLDDDGNAILTDFGLAKIMSSNLRVTQSGTMVGTPAYMSPEQWRGEPADTRSDIYALGVMLFEMLGGKLPFDKDSTAGMMYAHLNEPPPSIDMLRPELSPEVNMVVLRALAKDPRDRYQSAAEMAEAFHEAVQDVRTAAPALLNLSPRSTSPLLTDPPPSAAQSPATRPVTQPALDSPSAVLQQRVTVPLWRIMVALTLLATAIIVVALLVVNRSSTPSVTPTPATSANIAPVQPVARDEYMVLVAPMEQAGKQLNTNVTRDIVDNLTQTLDTGIPFSKLRIRTYPQAITSAQDALAAAKASNASIIVWGKTRDDGTELDIQVGTLTAFPYNKIAEDVIRRFADVRVKLTDSSVQSVAPYVLTVLNALQTADGNAYEVMRTLALLDQAKVKGGEVVGNTLAAVMTRTELIYLSDTKRFINEIQNAIALDAGSPLPYAYRALAYQRLQKYDEARRDMETVSRLGPPGWAIPLYLQAADVFLAQQDFPRSVKVYGSIVAARPNDWFAATARGFSYYRLGQYDLARADFNSAIANGPNANVPYLAAMLLAFREGRIGDAQKLASTILTRFPDPLLASRIISAAFGDPAESGLYVGPLFSAGANTLLGQYDSVLKDVDLALKTADNMPDLYLLQGVAYCGLNKYADAEKAYSRALELDPKYAVVYALRAEARIKQNNMPGALLDVAQAKNAKLGAEFDGLVDAGLKGEVGCQNFFSPKESLNK